MRGGYREGAGRPKGSRNQRTKDLVERAEDSGLMPIDFLLEVMRDEENDLKLRVDAASRIAPYLYPKLAAEQITIKNEMSLADLIVGLGNPDDQPK